VPKVEIDTPGVTIRVEGNEASINELGALALQLFTDANKVDTASKSAGPAFGFSNEKRWTPAAEHVKYGGVIDAPVIA